MNKCIVYITLLLVSATSYAHSHPSSLNHFVKKNRSKTNLTKYLNKKDWNELFPNRYGVDLKDTINKTPFFYSFEAFVTAAKLFPDFLSEKNKDVRKRELAAFLANIAQETNGSSEEATGNDFKWGLYFLEEKNINSSYTYNDTARNKYPGIAGKYYYGRGPGQLSWNYNYGKFSEVWYGSKDTLLQHPELLSEDPVLSFAAAIWFWMTPQSPKPSCHDIIIGKWNPTSQDIQSGRLPGFGSTLNVINGGLECGTGNDMPKTENRYGYYLYFCNYFKISPGENISCSNQKPFGQ